MIYSVAVLTVILQTKTMILSQQLLASPHPIVSCVTTVKRPTLLQRGTGEKVYKCTVEKLYASMTGIEFVSLTVTGQGKVSLQRET